MDLTQGHSVKGLIITWTLERTYITGPLEGPLGRLEAFPCIRHMHSSHPLQIRETLLTSIFKEACCVLMKYFGGVFFFIYKIQHFGCRFNMKDQSAWALYLILEGSILKEEKVQG